MFHHMACSTHVKVLVAKRVALNTNCVVVRLACLRDLGIGSMPFVGATMDVRLLQALRRCRISSNEPSVPIANFDHRAGSDTWIPCVASCPQFCIRQGLMQPCVG